MPSEGPTSTTSTNPVPLQSPPPLLPQSAPTPQMVRFAGFRSPTYTPVPDELFDELLSSLSGAELKVLLYIIRRTFGFKKQAEHISLSQIRSGITTRAGRVLDRGTGLSLSATQAAIKGLVAKGVVIAQRNRSAEKGDQATTYSLRLLGQQVQQDDGNDPRVAGKSTQDRKSRDEDEREGDSREDRDGEHGDRNAPVYPMGSGHPPGTENRQGGLPAIGSGGYRESAPQETGSQQTEISVRNSKASRQERGEREDGSPATLTPLPGIGIGTGGTIHAHNTGSAGNPTRAEREGEEAFHASGRASSSSSLSPAASAVRSYSRTVQNKTPRSLGEVLATRRDQLTVPAGQEPQPQQQVRDRYGRVKPTPQVAVAVTEIAQEFGDVRHLGANCTQAMRLWEASGRGESTFVSALYEARAITKQQPRVGNRMSYFWTVVRDLVGLLDKPPSPVALTETFSTIKTQQAAAGNEHPVSTSR